MRGRNGTAPPSNARQRGTPPRTDAFRGRLSGYCTLAQAARLKGVSRQALFGAIRRGALRASRRGGIWLVSRSSLRRYRVNRTLQANARGSRA